MLFSADVTISVRCVAIYLFAKDCSNSSAALVNLMIMVGSSYSITVNMVKNVLFIGEMVENIFHRE
jgi:hypothetical protein